MEHFFPCELSDSGALKLFPGEVSLSTAGKVVISSVGRQGTKRQSGTLQVTTHRITWVGEGVAVHASLSSLANSRTPVTDVTRSFPPSFRLQLSFGNGIRLDFTNAKTARADKDRLAQCLDQALRRKQWLVRVLSKKEAEERATPAAMAQSGSGGMAPLRPSQMVGIAGHINVKRYAADSRGQQISSGFQSLETLMASADNLIQIASRYRNLDADIESDNELLNIMAEMGIDSPVTKATSGNNTKLYRLELARQLADYLPVPIVKSGGVMTATDAYCLVNRARATVELVSPDDFVASLALFTHASVGSRIEVCVLQDGVLALRLDVSSESGAAEVLLELAERRTSISAIDVMRERKLPVQVAVVMLEAAEARGFLARDETTSGLRFFPNRFSAFVASSKA